MVATGVSPRPWMSYGSSAPGVAVPVVFASSSDQSSSLSSVRFFKLTTSPEVINNL